MVTRVWEAGEQKSEGHVLAKQEDLSSNPAPAT